MDWQQGGCRTDAGDGALMAKRGRKLDEFAELASAEQAAARLRVERVLRSSGGTVDSIAAAAQVKAEFVRTMVAELEAAHVIIRRDGGKLSVGRDMAPAWSLSDVPFEYRSRKDNTYLFGAVSDSHLGSKYERMDALNDLYDRFAAAGVDRVIHCGNWVDGDSRLNAHDLHTRGLEPQLAYLAREYPHRKGIVTYAVTGEDHEGWWTRSEGIDIGKRAEQTMREAGRDDWVNIGFMEAHLRLVNENSGEGSILAAVHPGGGTAYALSYSVQKIIEALEGGEKPGVALYGHYHKLWCGNIRNVWVAQTGCTQDQTIFTRNKIKQEVHIGGLLVELEQDPRTGAIIAMAPQMIRYFAKGYYTGRWSRSGTVRLPRREIS